ncbi:MAG: hypothetical protein JWN44_7027 [Myxococcales bacterium]|nr:hypothetical protein [Myxococcales bacterium]
MTHDTGGRWLLLWNAGLLCGLIGLPALLGFFAGGSIESSPNMPGLPWRLIFVGVGVLVGAFAAWRTLMPRSTRPPE